MKRLLRAETYKLLHNRLTWVVLFALIITTLFLGWQIDRETKDFKDRQTERYNYSRMLSLVVRKIMVDGVDGDRTKLDRAELEFWDENVTTTSILSRAMEGTLLVDETVQAQMAIRRWKNLLNGLKEGWIPGETLYNLGEGHYTLQYNIVKQESLIEQENFEKLFPDIDAWNMQASLRNKGLGLAIALASFMLTIQLFSEEFSSGSYMFYYSQPFARRKAISTKIVMIPIIVISLVCITYLFSFLITGFLYGFGDSSAPEVYHSVSLLDSIRGTIPQIDNLNIVPIWKIISLSTLIDSIGIILVSILLVGIYQFSKSQMITLGISILVVAINFLISLFIDPTLKLFSYWPTALIHSFPSLTGRQIHQVGLWFLIALVLGFISMIGILKSFSREDLDRRYN